MLGLAKRIKKWAPMVGIWNISTSNPVYLKPQEENNRPYGQPYGICVSDVRFQGGKVNVTVSLPKAEDGSVHPDTAGAILFGYRSLNDEYLAIGLGSYRCAYTLLRFTPDRGWVGIEFVGSLQNLVPEKPYVLSARMQGLRVILEVDGVQVLEHTLETTPQGRLGLYTWGPRRVEFTEASVTEEAGNVFVIMPFSDYYINEFFADVIKPTVEEGDNNLVAHHAGETLGPGIIIKDIEDDISESTIVIADISEKNQNVWYEIGYAHGKKKTDDSPCAGRCRPSIRY
jgi:hypothetical protein